MEDKLYSVTLRSKNTPHKVEAAAVRTEGGRVIFTNAEGEETGIFNAADVMGYSVEPDMPSFDVAQSTEQRTSWPFRSPKLRHLKKRWQNSKPKSRRLTPRSQT
jgi:hypothetical protein